MYLLVSFFLIIRRPPISTRTATLFPYPPLFRSYPADRRHRVRRVTDEQHPRLVPCLEPVDAHREQLDVVPARNRIGPGRRLGAARRAALSAGVDSFFPYFLGASIGKDHGALLIIPTIYLTKTAASLQTPPAQNSIWL